MNILDSEYKRELEQKLTKARWKLAVTNINLLFLSFCVFIFYPVIVFMISINPHLAIQFESALEEKVASMESLVDEFDSMVNEYNSL